MRSGTRTLAWDTPMPATPVQQGHESPARGDNKGAVRRAHRAPDGADHIDAVDGNMTVMAGRLWMGHGDKPGEMGYRRVVRRNGRGTRRMTPAELRRRGDQWGEAGIRRWRRANGEAPMLYAEFIAYCVANHVVCVGEEKSPILGVDARYLEHAVEVCKKHGHPAWFKTLGYMRNAEGKTRLTQQAGGQIALVWGKRIRRRNLRVAASQRLTARWSTKPIFW